MHRRSSHAVRVPACPHGDAHGPGRAGWPAGVPQPARRGGRDHAGRRLRARRRPRVVGVLAAVGTALPLAALAVTAAVPATVDPRWFAVVLAVDVAAIALIRGDVPSIGVSALFTLPALWAGYAFGFPGAATTTAFAVGLLWVGAPGEWAAIDSGDTGRLVSLPLVIAAVSGTAAALARRGRARQELLHDQAAVLRRRLGEVTAREELVRAVLDSVDFDVLAFDADGNTTVTNAGRSGAAARDLAARTTADGVGSLVRRPWTAPSSRRSSCRSGARTVGPGRTRSARACCPTRAAGAASSWRGTSPPSGAPCRPGTTWSPRCRTSSAHRPRRSSAPWSSRARWRACPRTPSACSTWPPATPNDSSSSSAASSTRPGRNASTSCSHRATCSRSSTPRSRPPSPPPAPPG